ncbi:PadR family transcriptional regulator [Paenibacillus sp. NEAU-GSW1]|uniref:PadR family transcriptional regulator n=1 Tax=Paenibacillus sp. NEAU-GSW1 TaxID=2682486 RepID=UPI0012E1C03B|nr:PadR family transcriptional regulator [Paenibacillus sp. NEAU-GSW1]MUT68551.1 PadR family transcriptional regulator [Paenibacillus sp. NEAU-GSW1]
MSNKLLVLGLLMEKDRHPYEIRQTIKGRNWDQTFRVKDGSLYYAVDQLKQEGLIEVAEMISVPGDNRPDKTVYRITESGKAKLLEMIYEQMKQGFYPQHPLFMTLPFVRHTDLSCVSTLVEQQLEASICRINHIESVLDYKKEWLPRGALVMIEGVLRFNRAEKEWLEHVLEEARNGRLAEAPPCSMP